MQRKRNTLREHETKAFSNMKNLELIGGYAGILSATIVAPKASEMISLLTAHIYNGLSVYKLSSLIFPYPVLSEGVKKAADSFVFTTLPKLPQELGAYLRYRWAKPGKPAPRRERLEPARS